MRKKYQGTHYPDPKPWPLKKDRTKHYRCTIGLIGADYVSPTFYRSKIKKYLKAYILLFS